MNKSALKTFATNARRELLKKVEAKAMKIGITEDNIKKVDIESSDAIFIDGRQLSKEEKIQRDRLIDRINQIGFKRVIEEVAYTWFNRFTALRFMEVNDYLPTKVRVLSSAYRDSAEPDIIKEALSLDLDLNKEYIYELKMNNSSEELFKYLIIKHCNDLNRYMPFMFETIDDYSEILFPDGLLATDSFLRYMTNTDIIPEGNWKEIEVIGWLYQYYIVEEKDQVFANLKRNIKISKDTLPAATQLFTPNWIVRYMVENSLGRIWIENNPTSKLRPEWRYFLDEANQEETVINQLDEIRYKNVNPEEITFLDPSCGSGHILVYAFDVFYDIYLEKGYVESEIPQLILEKNLFGLDIDDRAAQLASFAVMMKAREKSRRIFRNAVKPNIYSIQESNWLTDEMISNVSGNDNQIRDILSYIRDTFLDAKEYGSILEIEPFKYELIENRFKEYINEQADLVEMIDKQIIEDNLPALFKQSLMLSGKYDVCCTNPPYVGKNGMGKKLYDYIGENYPDSKTDLFAVFIERGFNLVKEKGFNSMVTMQSWMFLSSFEKFRTKLINEKSITGLLYMDNMVMGIAFGTSAAVFRNKKIWDYKGTYTEVKYTDLNSDDIPKFFPIKENKNNEISIEDFTNLPGAPFAFWLSDNYKKAFSKNIFIQDFGQTRKGMVTADNNRFIRHWSEVNIHKIGFNCNNREEAKNTDSKWFPYQKGGGYRKWYGNNGDVVNWENEGYELLNMKGNGYKVGSTNHNLEFIFKPAIIWNKITSGKFSARYSEEGYLFDDASPFFSGDEQMSKYVLAILCSKIGEEFLKIINPTVNFQPGNIGKIPLIVSEKYFDEIIRITNENINISKKDWDSFEIAWDFKVHPLLAYNYNGSRISVAYENWESETIERINKLKVNEETLNSIFFEVYGLQNEFNPYVKSEDISLRKADRARDIKSFISYMVGTIFGRYSLNKEGAVFAGGEYNSSYYKSIPVDRDNILPILPGTYFEEDIVSRIVNFVRISYGEENLNENLDFIADALGRKNSEASKETLRRYLLNDFYKEHIKTYDKKPIYWLFTSGKEKAFNCLIYLHRYDRTTLSRIRTDYLHDYQIRLDAEKRDLLNIIEGDSTAKEISNAKKELKSLEKKIDELKSYDELLHHMADMQIEIDLDDGVKVNYEKFEGLVAKI
ncbi:BREX-1 system adenine-specific DNA-methyltransferase PglX [Niallia taxi]|uniref:BREX-1 system adenine-specific DNA-methyltransferase PglX n=1 Tax=Niallia taxi TaxID=2499688 RepID=UPI00254E8912|nr:BREX-1 system adenine-specific DNA-methyltransferase PglX [Niallia taxi]MDK8643456.1 BREX-1 system adenine-specific DNA-methyltransferase PglX [Niallia taxi]